MPTTPEGFAKRLDRLKADLTDQGRRVHAVIERAVEAAFEPSDRKAAWVTQQDHEIDRVDVNIERACVALLADATNDGAALNEGQLRMVLTIVKLNNELERIADAAVAIAEQTAHFVASATRPPEAFRVMANSVIGIYEASLRAFDVLDTEQARAVLASEDTALAFKKTLLRDTEEALAAGTRSVDTGFALHEIAASLDRIADHCSNVAEQVIYLATGAIVRHEGGKWTSPEQPR